MFCFQCEQTAGCTGAAGVCGKKSDTAVLQDQLTGALIGLARAASDNKQKITASMNQLVLEALFSTLTNINFDNEAILALIGQVNEAKNTNVLHFLVEKFNIAPVTTPEKDLKAILG